MIIKVSKSYRMQNMSEVWSSVLTYVMTTGRLVGGSVVLIRPVFSPELSNAIWKNKIREITKSWFSQLYHYFVVITEKYNGDLLQRTSYERLKSF